jgi:hypothetical protein
LWLRRPRAQHPAHRAAEALATSVRPRREKYPDVEVETLVAQGGAGRVLVDVSSSAGLVVVGSHGHGAIAGTCWVRSACRCCTTSATYGSMPRSSQAIALRSQLGSLDGSKNRS